MLRWADAVRAWRIDWNLGEVGLDIGLFHTINGIAGQWSWLDRLLDWGTQGLPAVLALLVAGVWFWPGEPDQHAQRQRLALYAVTAALLGLALAQVIGHIYFRDRPYLHHSAHLVVAPSGDASFPSDHAVGGFALAVPFVLARRRIGWLLLGLATVLAISRVAVGTHYPSDVLGGALLGTVSAVAVWRARAWLEYPLTPCFMLARRLHLA
jgi:undecaprenyl-diphosphatase